MFLKVQNIFFSEILQNYLVFISAKKCLIFFIPPMKSIHENLKECQKKLLKMYLHQRTRLIQLWLVLVISYILDPWSRDLNIDFTLGNF